MRRLVRQIGGWPGVANLLRQGKRGPVILFYHGVEDRSVDPRIQNIHLRLSDFERHVAYVRKHFRIISMDELYDCMVHGAAPDPSCVVITFDDGYRNNRTIAGPYLDAMSIPYAVFVSTRHIDEGLRFPTYYLRAAIWHTIRKEVSIGGSVMDIRGEQAKLESIRAISRLLKTLPLAEVGEVVDSLIALLPPEQWHELDDRYASDAPMTWEEVKELSALGATIGSHCHDHCILHENQQPDEITHQVQTSKQVIERQVGECHYIAYPNGGVNDMCAEALQRVREQDYRLGLTTVEGEVVTPGDAYLLPRIPADTADIDRFKFNLNLAYRHNKNYREWANI